MNPLALLFAKQKVRPALIDDAELNYLVMLDDFKSDRITEDSFTTLACFLVLLRVMLFSNKAAQDQNTKAIEAMNQAADVMMQREAPYLAPSTTQKRLILAALAHFPTAIRQANNDLWFRACALWCERREEMGATDELNGFVKRVMSK